MTDWPDKPLIRIIDGHQARSWEVAGVLAFRSLDGDYYIPGRGRLSVGDGDSIDAWEEVTAVPTAALEEFKEAWKGFGMYDADGSQRVTDAITSILACLPVDKPSALDRAVTRAKDIEGGRMIDADSTQEERLSLLLDALASVQGAARKTAPLTMVARICADWASLENPHSDGLAEIRSRAEGNPVRADFIVLSSFIGDIATSLDDGMSDGPRGDLIEMGWYALAWATQIIEEEDK